MIASRFKGGAWQKRGGWHFWGVGRWYPNSHYVGLYLSLEYLSNFLSKLYIPISHRGLGKMSYLCCSYYSKMHLRVKKLDLQIFTHAHPGKFLPKVLIITPRQREITHSPLAAMFFWKSVSPSRLGVGGRDYAISIFELSFVFYHFHWIGIIKLLLLLANSSGWNVNLKCQCYSFHIHLKPKTSIYFADPTKLAKFFIRSFEVPKKTNRPDNLKNVCTNFYPYSALRKNELNHVALKLIIKVNLGHVNSMVTS